MTACSSPNNKNIRLQRVLSVMLILGLLFLSFSLVINNVTPAHAQAPATATPTAETPVPGTPAAGTVNSPLMTNSIVFHKSYPTNGLGILANGTTTVQLEWTDAGIDTTSDKYEYCIDESNNNNCDTSWNARKSLHSGPGDVVVVSGHTYYWQVRTQNAQVQADSGVWWSFAIVPLTVTIAGNTGVTSVTLSYFDGTPKNIVSSAIDGSYIITVPGGWSGTVTPSKTGWAFSPAFRSYTTLAANQINQNYAQMPTISGTTGVSGTTVVFLDGASVLTTTDSKGNYSLAVPLNWAGSVTPIQICSTFAPVNHDYSSTPVTVPLASQNFTASVNAGCAGITVKVAAATQGIYNIQQGGSNRANYAGLDSGPVQVQSSTLPIITALRDAWSGSPTGGTTTSFAQLMGLPDNQLSDTYYFPSYNNIALDEQLRIGNVDTVDSTVNVTIGGISHGPYLLHAGQAMRVNYVGVDSGPVVVHGSAGVHIIAAERDAWSNNPAHKTTSFVQFMGLPAGALSDTYFFPAYNNVSLNEQLRIANVDTVDSTVAVAIGGSTFGPYLLHAGDAMRVNYPGVDSGPLVVEGSAGVHIIAALRDAWSGVPTGGTTTSFAQLMGLPASQVSDTYLFPAYNNVSLDEQLRIANVDTVDSTVNVTIGGVPQGSYLLQPNHAVRVNYAGLDSGPVVVQGTPGVHIIAAERDAWSNNPTHTTTSFAQFMGLPAGLLSNTYEFPAYNNVSLDEQLRFANVDAGDSTVKVTIGGVLKGTYTLHSGDAMRVNYPGLDSGPVVVQGTSGVHIIAAERDTWSNNPTHTTTSFVQLMGLPAGLLSTTYLFPAYNNVSLDEQLRFGVP
jgi:hypothetical protein